MRTSFKLICDEGMTPVQASLEVHRDEELVAIITWEPGPFDGPLDCWKEACERYFGTFGVQTRLPL